MVDGKNDKQDKDFNLTDTIKKVISVGVGAAFMTEDAIKNILQDVPLPKDILQGLTQSAKATKTELRFERTGSHSELFKK